MDRLIAKPWLSLQCQMIPGVRHAVFAANQRADGAFGTLETWPDGADAPPALAALLQAAMASGSTQTEPAGTGAWLVASPLRRGGAVCGAVAVDVGGLEEAQVPVVVQLMNWGSAWPAFLADQEDARQRERASPAAALATELLSGDSLSAALAAAATRLARSVGARQAAIGLRDGDGVTVAALSGRAVFDRRNERVRLLEAAMNEACDQGATVTVPAADEPPLSVCGMPLRAGAELCGALVLLRDAGRPFTADEARELNDLAALIGATQHARQRAERSAWARLRETVAEHWDRLTGRGHRRFKAGVAAAAVALAFVTFAHGTHTVPAQARLAGLEERELVAPADGFVAEAIVRAGARVQAGDLLATLDDSALKLERKRRLSQRDELSNEYHRALGELDRGAARVLQAQIAQAEAQLALVNDTIERTRVVAPFDGLIVSGDLSQSVGRPVATGEALFTVAPLDGYRVVLEVDEASVPDVGVGTGGRLALAALPGERFELRVTRLNGMARAVDGRNVLEIEAELVGDSPHLRPGMKGVARLDAGRERLVWIWTHSVADKLRLWWWAWSPIA